MDDIIMDGLYVHGMEGLFRPPGMHSINSFEVDRNMNICLVRRGKTSIVEGSKIFKPRSRP